MSLDLGYSELIDFDSCRTYLIASTIWPKTAQIINDRFKKHKDMGVFGGQSLLDWWDLMCYHSSKEDPVRVNFDILEYFKKTVTDRFGNPDDLTLSQNRMLVATAFAMIQDYAIKEQDFVLCFGAHNECVKEQMALRIRLTIGSMKLDVPALNGYSLIDFNRLLQKNYPNIKLNSLRWANKSEKQFQGITLE